jgi:hypothetical protein
VLPWIARALLVVGFALVIVWAWIYRPDPIYPICAALLLGLVGAGVVAFTRQLAASAVVEYPPGALLASAGAGADALDALTGPQRQFLQQCAKPGVAVEHLTALGPIASTKWGSIHLPGQRVDAERWTVLDLDFLELSIRVKPKPGDTPATFSARAEKEQHDLHTAIAGLGLQLCTNNENKTQRVLTALLASALH